MVVNVVMPAGTVVVFGIQKQYQFSNVYIKRDGVFVIVPGICNPGDLSSSVWNRCMSMIMKRLGRSSLQQWLTLLREVNTTPRKLAGSDCHHVTRKYNDCQNELITLCCVLVNFLLRNIEVIEGVFMRSNYDAQDAKLKKLHSEICRLEKLEWVPSKKTYRKPNGNFILSFLTRSSFDSASKSRGYVKSQRLGSMVRQNNVRNMTLKNTNKYPRTKG